MPALLLIQGHYTSHGLCQKTDCRKTAKYLAFPSAFTTFAQSNHNYQTIK